MGFCCLQELPKGRGYYRMQAGRDLAGGGEVINRQKIHDKLLHILHGADANRELEDPLVQVIYFDRNGYQVMENAGSLHVTVIRDGKNLNNTVVVDFNTEDG